MRFFVLLLIIGIISGVNGFAETDAASEKARLESVIAGLKKGRDAINQVNTEAARTLKLNLLKTTIKGAMDTREILDLAKAETAFEPIWFLVQPYVFDEATYWGYATKKEAHQPYLGSDAGERYTDLKNMYAVMCDVLKSKDLKRFDSDEQPFRYTSRWWSPPDFKEDGWLQTITRRTYVIRELSAKILQKTEQEITAAEKELARLSLMETPARAGIFEKKYVNRNNEISIRITDVEILKIQENYMRDNSLMGGNVYLCAPASSCLCTVRYRLEGLHEYDTVYVNTGITELDEQMNTVSRKYIDSDHHQGKNIFSGEFTIRLDLSKHMMEPLFQAVNESGDIYVQIFVAPYELRSRLIKLMND